MVSGVWKGGGGVREDTGRCEPAVVLLLGLLWSPRERQSPAASRSPRAGRARPLQQSEGLLPAGAQRAGCGQSSRFAPSC